jgi:hypothetical protein
MHGPVPPIQIYIHVLLHKLGMIAGNHFNGPYRVTDRVQHLSEYGIPITSLETLCESPEVITVTDASLNQAHPFPNLLPKYKFVGTSLPITHTLKMRLIKGRYNSGKTIS